MVGCREDGCRWLDPSVNSIQVVGGQATCVQQVTHKASGSIEQCELEAEKMMRMRYNKYKREAAQANRHLAYLIFIVVFNDTASMCYRQSRFLTAGTYVVAPDVLSRSVAW